MADINKDKRVKNTVHDNEIWKQTINYELNTAKNWENNWGFIREAYLKQQASQFQNSNTTETALPPITNRKIAIDPKGSGLPSKLKPGLTENPDSIIQDWLQTYKVQDIVKYRYPAGKYSYPATTSTEVGWPWGRADQLGKGEEEIDKKVNSEVDFDNRACRSKFYPKYYTLERYGKYAKGQGNVMKWWGGTRESLP